MALKRSSEIPGGSSFFKPAEFADAVALLIEPKSVQRDVPNTYAGVTKNRDEVTADVTVFATAADLANGKGVEHKAMTFTHPGITNRLSRAIDEAVVGKMGKKQFDKAPAPAWVVDDVDDATFDKVAEFYEAREAAVKAALEDAPDFD
jgi:hypothetical protein